MVVSATTSKSGPSLHDALAGPDRADAAGSPTAVKDLGAEHCRALRGVVIGMVVGAACWGAAIATGLAIYWAAP